MSLKEQSEAIRSTLDSLLNQDDLALSNEMQNNAENLPELPGKLPMQNFSDIKSIAETKASKTIKTLMKFYLDEDIISKNEYISAKRAIDEMSMASLIYQLKAGEIAMTRILENIEMGETSPRIFEVLAILQKTNLDIIKSQTQYLQFTEDSVKRIARDYEMYNQIPDNTKSTSTTKNDNTFRGSKGLLQILKQSKEEIQDAEFEES